MTIKRLLAVDDDQRFGDFVRLVAEGAGYEVEVTSDGETFMKRYGAFKPNTVIIDMIMPYIDGIELVQWVSARKAPARVIVVTGHSPEYASFAKILGEGRGLGTVIALIKPIKLAHLHRVLDELEYETVITA